MAQDLVHAENVYDSDEKAYAAWLYRKSGVDFRQFRHTELSDTATSLISPLDHAIAFAIGFIPAAALVMVSWYFLFRGLPEDTMAVGGFVSGLCALFFGAWIGFVVVVARTFKALLGMTELGTKAVRSVRDEIKNVSPRALERLSSSEILTGAVWIALLPALRVVLKRRFKVPYVGETVASGIRLVAKRVVPMKVPDDADAQIAKLERDEQLRKEALAAKSIKATTVELSDPFAEQTKVRNDSDWVSLIETKKPKVVKGLRTVRRIFLVPMIGFSAVFLTAFLLLAYAISQMAGAA